MAPLSAVLIGWRSSSLLFTLETPPPTVAQIDWMRPQHLSGFLWYNFLSTRGAAELDFSLADRLLVFGSPTDSSHDCRTALKRAPLRWQVLSWGTTPVCFTSSPMTVINSNCIICALHRNPSLSCPYLASSKWQNGFSSPLVSELFAPWDCLTLARTFEICHLLKSHFYVSSL